MNDIVFAGNYGDFRADKYGRCLKIFVPCRGGSGGKVSCGGQSLSYGCGEVVVLPPNADFGLPDADDGDGIVCIERPLLPKLYIDVLTDTDDGGERFRFAFGEACRNLSADGDGTILAALGDLLVSYVGHYFRCGLHPVVKQIKADVERGLSDPNFSVDAVIKKLPLNYDYVRKLFKKQTGTTPHAYLTEMRLERARTLLTGGFSNAYSGYSIAQIAEACGFSEPLYFSRVFTKRFGVPPSKYSCDRCDL